MTWVVGRAGQRQVVSSGDRSCVPIDEWLAGSFIWVLSNIVFRIPHKSSMINHHILGHSTLCQIDEPIISDQQVVLFFFLFFPYEKGLLAVIASHKLMIEPSYTNNIRLLLLSVHDQREMRCSQQDCWGRIGWFQGCNFIFHPDT